MPEYVAFEDVRITKRVLFFPVRITITANRQAEWAGKLAAEGIPYEQAYQAVVYLVGEVRRVIERM